eukprot:1257336-Pyramimonas_sp.AAC.1
MGPKPKPNQWVWLPRRSRFGRSNYPRNPAPRFRAGRGQKKGAGRGNLLDHLRPEGLAGVVALIGHKP